MSFIKSAVQGALKRVNDTTRELELRTGKPMQSAVFAKMRFAATQAEEVLQSQRDQGSPDVDELRERIAELNEGLRKAKPFVHVATDLDAQIERDEAFEKLLWISTKSTYRVGDAAESARSDIGKIRRTVEMSLAREEGARGVSADTANGSANGNGATANAYGSLIDAPTKATAAES